MIRVTGHRKWAASRRAGRAARMAAIGLIAALSHAQSRAHPGPHHDIERLTRLLDGPTAGTAASAEALQTRAGWLTERGLCRRLDDDFMGSLRDLDDALALAPGLHAAMLQRGMTLAALRRDAEALAQFDRYIAAGGRSAQAHVERATIHERAGRPDAALADYAAAAHADPDVETLLRQVRLCRSLGRVNDAAAACRDGFERLNHPVVLRRELILLEQKRGRVDAALALIDELLPTLPLKADWRLLRAEVLDAAGRGTEAATERRRALDEARDAVRRRGTAMNREMLTRALSAAGERADVDSSIKNSPLQVHSRSNP